MKGREREIEEDRERGSEKERHGVCVPRGVYRCCWQRLRVKLGHLFLLHSLGLRGKLAQRVSVAKVLIGCWMHWFLAG